VAVSENVIKWLLTKEKNDCGRTDIRKRFGKHFLGRAIIFSTSNLVFSPIAKKQTK